MASVLEQALGTGFQRLHPRLRERFVFGSEDGVSCAGSGVMERIWPDRGGSIPFTVEDYARRDGYGRETLALVYRTGRRTIVDFLGTQEHFAVALHSYVDRRGGLWFHTRSARLHEWWDEGAGCFRADVRVRNRYLGLLFAYRGRFTVEFSGGENPAV